MNERTYSPTLHSNSSFLPTGESSLSEDTGQKSTEEAKGLVQLAFHGFLQSL